MIKHHIDTPLLVRDPEEDLQRLTRIANVKNGFVHLRLF